MFKSLKQSAARASVLTTVLFLFIGLQAALLGAATNLAFDAFTNPAVRFAWTVAIQLAKHKLGEKPTPPKISSTAKKTMRRPVKANSHTNSRTNSHTNSHTNSRTSTIQTEVASSSAIRRESESESVDEL